MDNGVGPLRIWPGGLCLSRAIGDFDVGDSVIPFPHVMQARGVTTSMHAHRWPAASTQRVSLGMPSALLQLNRTAAGACHPTCPAHCLPLPNRRCSQVMVPTTGARLLIASDGVWDAYEKVGGWAHVHGSNAGHPMLRLHPAPCGTPLTCCAAPPPSAAPDFCSVPPAALTLTWPSHCLLLPADGAGWFHAALLVAGRVPAAADPGAGAAQQFECWRALA